jgi:carboxypeptidase C (cathepsin A)
LSEFLHERYGIDLNGIVLISTVLNFQTLDFDAGNDTGFPLFLPTYTAIAHYHKRLPPDLQAKPIDAVIAESEAFATGDYTAALMKGTSLTDQEREKIEQQLSRFTGISIETVRKANLRLSPFRFEKLLLADQGKIIGRMDGRISGFDADPLSSGPEYDPSISGYAGPFNSTFNDYVKLALKYESDVNYEFLSGLVGGWDFGNRGNGYLNVATTLRRCMTKLPATKVFFASGYYDLATPFFAADVTINQMPLPKELRSNIQHRKYEGGHMMYLNKSAMESLADDVQKFFESAVAN